MDFKIGVYITFGYIMGCYTIKQQEELRITLFTDLVDIIGKNESCFNKQEPNNSTLEEEHLYTKQGIVLSKYTFHDVNSLHAVINKCDVIDVHLRQLDIYNWTCFASSNSSTRDPPNWFFVDCQQLNIASIQCLDVKEVNVVKKNLCDMQVKEDNTTCRAFTYRDGQSALCSQKFRLKRLILPFRNTEKSNINIEHTVAYLCVAFILTTFLITVLIPAQKCKPTYIYDKEQTLRVPLQIYEMYGVSYQPSAKKKRNRKSVNMDAIPTITSHMNNLAAVANNPVDWKGFTSKFKFEHGQPLFHGLSIEALDEIGFSERNEQGKYTACSRNRVSIVSNESVGIFDYTLFENDNDDDIKRPVNTVSNQETAKSSFKEENTQVMHNNKATVGEKSKLVEVNKVSVAEFEEDSIQKHEKGNSVRFAQDISPLYDSESFQACNCDNITSICSMDDAKQKHGVLGRNVENDKDDSISSLHDSEIYDNDNSFLLPIHEDVSEGGHCICSDVNASSLIHDEDITIKRVCQVSDLGEDGEPSMIPEHVDVNVSNEMIRPRISITLEFPNNFGIKSGAQLENIKVIRTQKETERKLDAQRNASTRSAHNNRNMLNQHRKYSLC